ncbi:MAG: dihydroorotase, partial [bacterium]|nr:dihydroorotase [bacterium]
HGEVTDPGVDVFDREAVYIETTLRPLLARHPKLKVVLEHLTTAEGVEFVEQASRNVAATLTAHHLLFSRNAIFAGGINPHMFCLPILKREKHREALVRAATSGSGKFFLGTDSAPHTLSNKENGCGCAGIYTAHAAMEFYAEVFEQAGALDKLEGFASFYGADFYGLPRNNGQITLEKQEWVVPPVYEFSGQEVKPLSAGLNLGWRIKQSS